MPDAPQPAPEPLTTARYRALLDISETISRHLDLDELLHALARRLQPLIPFDLVAFVLYDAASDKMRLRTLDAVGEPLPFPAEVSRRDSISAWAMDHQQSLCLGTLEGETRWAPVLDIMRAGGIQSCCVLPLTTAATRLGALTLGSQRHDAYSAEDMEFLQHAAQQMAVSIENAINRHHAAESRAQLERERDRLQLILEMNNVLVSNLDLHELFPRISACLRGLVKHDYASLALHDPEQDVMRLRALVFPGGKGLVREELVYPVDGSPAGWVLEHKAPLLLDRMDTDRFPAPVTRLMKDDGVQSAIFLPLQTRNGVLGTMSVASVEANAFDEANVALLAQMARQVAIAVENALAFTQIAQLKDKLASERLYLEDEIRSQYNFEEIVGESAALQRVLQQVETVAPTNAGVLILGETGTGKELIARAIHNLSPRRERTFVKLSCAAIPTGLLESELFGHEKGAFTGALTQKLGRFELADRGTLFLDEVGEISLELQSKLLRALQEHEFERLGSTRTQRVDVRVVAATNRDLLKMVGEGSFRSDLYYRLNVFPILVPPLRERREDIPLLVRYFAQKFSRAMDRHIEISPGATMQRLQEWQWPGNIRELSNLIERAVILSSGAVLQVPLTELVAPAAAPAPAGDIATLEQNEREHILKVLRETGGVIAGPNGAAARLGLKRTTLHFKMKKLGIRREDVTES
ncbi:MAG TPA: sigma 54-interacting transcriptional regulator [Terriglobales bacterium]|nr:sigma 54-interacting transcriptional regulator [Terriglobales bacterium]